MSTRIRVEMKPINTILTRLGVDKNGDVQKQATRIINRRITRYMPYRTGALSTKLKYIKSPTEIEVLARYARYQYYGKVMVNSKTGKGPALIPGVGYRYKKGTILEATDKNLDQKPRSPGNDRAGPFWDRRLMANEGDAILAEIQEYIRTRGGKS